jgi:hypothetical protein
MFFRQRRLDLEKKVIEKGVENLSMKPGHFQLATSRIVSEDISPSVSIFRDF